MPCTSTRGADPPPDRPLPECLTRFLAAPAPDAIRPTPGDRVRGECPRPPPLPITLALKGTIAWAILYNVVGFAILYWVWSSMRVPA